jgi:hypothetical protein
MGQLFSAKEIINDIMKKNIALILILFNNIIYAQNKSAEQIQVERAVINWASLTFEYYEGARFEKYKKLPTREQYKIENQIADLTEYKAEMTDEYNKGKLNKSKTEFENNIKSIDQKIDSLNKVHTQLGNNPENKNDYEIDFWANIKVNNGLTVYFRHYVLLNNNFEVIKAEITGAVGKESDDLKILYKTKEAEEKYWVNKSVQTNPGKEPQKQSNSNNKTDINNNKQLNNNKSKEVNKNNTKKQSAKTKY